MPCSSSQTSIRGRLDSPGPQSRAHRRVTVQKRTSASRDPYPLALADAHVAEDRAAQRACEVHLQQLHQSTGFVVKPDKTIVVSQYSSGPIGRLVWQDILGFVQFYET